MTKQPDETPLITASSPLPPEHPLYGVPIEYDSFKDEYRFQKFGRVKFQRGPVSAENPVNGIGVEHLLNLALMRLAEYQRGSNPCGENKHAIESISQALDWLRRRTAGREARGVEGTEQA